MAIHYHRRSREEPIKPRSIRRGLVAVLILLQVLTVLVVLAMTRITSESVLVEQAKVILGSTANEVAEHTRGFIRPAFRATNTIADVLSQQVLKVSNDADVEQYFLSLLRTNPELAGVYLATVEGDFFYVSRNSDRQSAEFRTKTVRTTDNIRRVSLHWRDASLNSLEKDNDPNDAYDPHTRPWYNQAFNSRQVVWTEPYTFFTSQKPGITVAAPFFSEGNTIAGVVGIDIELTELSAFLTRLRLGAASYAFIVNRKQQLVALSTPVEREGSTQQVTLDTLRTVDEINNGVITQAFSKFDVARVATERTQMSTLVSANSVDYVAVFVPFTLPQSRDWVIGIQVPMSDLLATIQESHNQNVLLGLCVLLVSVAIGWVVFNRTSLPVVVLGDQAHLDHLTHLYNRRHFSAVVQQSFTAHRSVGSTLSIAIVDIDRFKQINDRYGHAVGDEILVAFSARLKSGLRASDIVARFGGEEFTVLMPETTIADAQSMLERIRHSIEADGFSTSAGKVDLTISAGVAALSGEDRDWNEILDRADQRLYDAKSAGRNEVVSAPG